MTRAMSDRVQSQRARSGRRALHVRAVATVHGFLAVSIAALAVADCAGADRAATSLETPPEEWWLVAAVRVGSVDGPDALTRIGAFLALPGGGAWFSQPMEQLVRIVDADGRLARGVGRRGQRPGEFTAIGPLGLWRGSPDTIWVMAWMPRRLSLFTADGAFVRTVPMPDVSWGDR